MDIITNNLSAKLLSANEVKINGFDIQEYFESKLSTAVNFVGVYKKLSDAPKKNGNIVIVEGIEYIYEGKRGKWIELGDETRIGQIATELTKFESSTILSVSNLSSSIENLKKYVDEKQLSSFSGNILKSRIEDFGNYLTSTTTLSDINGNEITNYVKLNDSDYKNESYSQISSGIGLSDYLLIKDKPSKTSDLENDSNFISAHQSLSGYATEKWVEEKNYLTEHQSLSDYSTTNEIKNMAKSISVDLNDDTGIIIAEIAKIITIFGGTVIPLSA